MPPSTPLPPPLIIPFWDRLPAIARYPLASSPLLTLVMYAVMMVLASHMVYGVFIRMLLLVAFFKYAFECLRASADGEEQAPDFGMKVSDHVGMAQMWMQLIFLLLIVAGYFSAGWTGIYIAMAIIAIAQPGANMSLAIDLNLWHAVNPVTWLSIMGRIPGPYLAVTALIFVFQSSQETVTGWMAGWMPRFLAEIVIQCGVNYSVLATFHLMGWLIWQYQDQLGYEPERKVVLKTVRDDPDQPLIERAEALARDGQIVEARDFLIGEIRARGATPAVHERYRKLLRALDDRPALAEHGRIFLSVLLAQDKDKPALDLLRECLALDAAFMPAQPEDASRLARKAAQNGLTEIALKLLAGFHKHWPRHKQVPSNLLYAARLLSEKLGQDEKARGLLLMLKQTYPGHVITPEVDQLLATIGQLGQPVRV